MRRKSALIQFFGAQGLMVLAMVQGVFLVPLYLKYIGAAQYGQWLSLGSMVTMLGLIDLGVTSLVIQKTGYFHGCGDLKSIGRFIGTVMLFNLVVSFFIIAIGIGLSFLLPHWIGARGPDLVVLKKAFQIATIDVMLMLLVSMTGSILFGIQKPTTHMLGLFFGTVANILVTIWLLAQGWGVLAIAMGSLMRPLIALPLNVFAIHKNLGHVLDRSILRFDREMTKSFFRSSIWLGPSKVAETLTAQVDNIVVIKVLNPIEVTMLNITRKAAEIAVQVVGRLSVSFMSGLAHLKGSGEEARIRTIVGDLFLFSSYLSCCILCAVLLLNQDFVTLWVKGSMYGGFFVTFLLCIYCLLKILRIATYNVVFSHGEVRITSISSYVESISQALFGVLFCRLWGIPGMVAASIVAVLLGGAIQVVALLRIYRFGLNKLSKAVAKVTISTCTTLAVGRYLHALYPAGTWFTLLSFSACIALLYMVPVLFLEPRVREVLATRLGWVANG